MTAYNNNAIYFKNIASGSKGNSTFIWDAHDLIVIDFGITMKKFKEAISELTLGGLNKSIFISHEHADHVSGIRSVKKVDGADVYTRPATAEAANIKAYEIDNEVVIGNFEILAFDVPHDAADPVAFTVKWKDLKISVVSDLGTVTENVISNIRDSDILAFESNHDVSMLKTGRYPASLKRRILSQHGHLSNEQSAEAISKAINESTEIVLTHLSQENNKPEIALNEVKSYLKNRDIKYKDVECADQYVGSSLKSLKT
ncbi:MBL fold metallo-hydrolase [Thermoplasma volcanium]|nr:MBL fold metallo-hydrolase [Thermoplasma volcanium]